MPAPHGARLRPEAAIVATIESAVSASGNGPLHPESAPGQAGIGRTTPELPAYDTGRNLIVWCSHCCRWHAHGRGHHVGSEGNGHRVAHCIKPNSPYDRTGYILWYVGDATPEIIKDLSRRRPRGPEVRP